jgi:2-hydroxychromene-2-carboxylate isomerase
MGAVEFHFDFGSPNAYLAHLVVPEIEKRTGAKFEYVPILLGGVFKLTNNRSPAESMRGIKNRLEYEELERQRFVRRHAITRFTFNPFFPVNTLLIMRGAVAAQLEGVFDRYVDEVFRHMWAEPKKMDDPEVVRVVLEQSGLNAAALLARTQEEHGSERCPRRLRQSDLLRRQRNILRQGPAARCRRRASPGKDIAPGVANERRCRTSCAWRQPALFTPLSDWCTLWAMGARGSLHARQWSGSPSGGEAVKRRALF